MKNILKKLNKNIIVCGHYGSGKTNVSVGLATAISELGVHGALIDLDIVNPYFRAADAAELMDKAGIDLIVPQFANTNVDIPSLGGEVSSVFAKQVSDSSYYAVFDIGGDNGAFALGRYRNQFNASGYSMVYVINMYRPLTDDADSAAEDMREIEGYSKLSACGVINNSNLGRETTLETVEASLDYAAKTAELLDLPLLCTTVHSHEICRILSERYPDHIFAVIPDSTKKIF